MKQDEFSERYIIKLSSSLVIAVINAVIQMLLPRALSVEAYGMYSYNLNIFTSIVVMSNLSSSNAMISKFSRRNEERGLLYFYLIFFFIISLLLNAVVFIVYILGGTDKFFGGQTIFLVLLGLNAAILNKLLTDTISMYDAMAISRFPAIVQIVLKVFLCVCICVGYFAGTLSLYVFYIWQSGITFVVLLILLQALLREHKKRYCLSKSQAIKVYCSEFYQFCKPLVLVSGWAQLMVIVMNWALMNFAGETEQAMYGAALQLNVLIGYVFSPYAELLKREFAVVTDNQEILRHKLLHAMQHMYWITAYFSIFIFLCADWIILFLFGNEYKNAVGVTQVIMLYTLYQAWGQVGGSFLLATEQTTKQAIFTWISQTQVLIFIFLFQVPNIFFPQGLGAGGIALNYMMSNFISTLITIRYCARYVDIKQLKMIEIQIKTLFCCISAAIIGRFLASFVTVVNSTTLLLLIKILTAGIVYTILISALLWRYPQMIGLKRAQIIQKLRRKR